MPQQKPTKGFFSEKTPRRSSGERRFIRRTIAWSILFAAVLFVLVFLYSRYRPEILQYRTESAIKRHDFTAALKIIAQVDDAELAASLNDECSYAIAQDLYDNGNYIEARGRFLALKDMENAAEMVSACSYAVAVSLYDAGSYTEAAEEFSALENYMDSGTRYDMCMYALAEEKLAAGELSAAATGFLALGDFSDARSRAGIIAMEILGEANPEAAIEQLQRFSLSQQQELLLLNEVRSRMKPQILAAGYAHSVALKNDGTVLACGENTDGQCETDTWTNVVAVDAGAYHTIALKSDGTVYAGGRNSEGQCDIAQWSDVVAIACGDYSTYGLTSDGKILIAGYSDTALAIDTWPSVSSIAAGSYGLAGLGDGTAYVSHPSYRSADLTGLIQIAVSTGYALGVREDGTLVCSSETVDLSDLPAAAAVSCSGTGIAVLDDAAKLNLHFFIAGNAYAVDTDAEIIAFDFGNLHTLVATQDGRVLAFSKSPSSACDTAAWNLLD